MSKAKKYLTKAITVNSYEYDQTTDRQETLFNKLY